MWDHTRMAWAIYWIIIGSFVQAQEFSTTVVKEGEDAIIQCGIQTTVEEGYMKWETIDNGIPVDLAYNLRDGNIDCDDRIINCTLYANGSIQLEYVSKEDGARYYRCLRGDEDGYHYYSDHKLLVLSKESPSISRSPTSAIAFNVGRKGTVHSYGEPFCEDDVDGNLPVVCYPPSGVIVDREYETIQCNCTDSDGLMDSVTFPVTKKTSSPPLFETPLRESISSYNMGKKGVLHCYNAPVCENDMDWNILVACYPPSAVIVDREYETIECICTDSDGQMDSVTFPVTRQMSSPPSIETPHRDSVSSYNMGKKGVLHGYNAPVCEDDVDGKLPVDCYPPSGIIVNRGYETIQCNCTDSDGLMDSVTFPVTSVPHGLHSGWTALTIPFVILIIVLFILILWILYMQYKRMKAKRKHPVNNSKIELTERVEELSPLTEQLEQKEKRETEMRNELEEQNQKINNIQTKLTAREEEVSNLKDQLKHTEKQETEMKNNLEEQNGKTACTEENTLIGTKDKHISDLEDQIATLEATFSKGSTQSELQVPFLEPLHELMDTMMMLETVKDKFEEQLEKISERSTFSESPLPLLEQLCGMMEMTETVKDKLEKQHEKKDSE